MQVRQLQDLKGLECQIHLQRMIAGEVASCHARVTGLAKEDS